MPASTSDTFSIFVWSLVLMGMLLAGFLVVAYVRRGMRQAEETPSIGFSLRDLREMHRQGQLSDDEFERAREKLASGILKKAKSRPPE